MVVLIVQYRRGLAIPTGEKEELCLFSEEEFCFYKSKLVLARDAVEMVANLASKTRQKASET